MIPMVKSLSGTNLPLQMSFYTVQPRHSANEKSVVELPRGQFVQTLRTLQEHFHLFDIILGEKECLM